MNNSLNIIHLSRLLELSPQKNYNVFNFILIGIILFCIGIILILINPNKEDTPSQATTDSALFIRDTIVTTPQSFPLEIDDFLTMIHADSAPQTLPDSMRNIDYIQSIIDSKITLKSALPYIKLNTNPGNIGCADLYHASFRLDSDYFLKFDYFPACIFHPLQLKTITRGHVGLYNRYIYISSNDGTQYLFEYPTRSQDLKGIRVDTHENVAPIVAQSILQNLNEHVPVSISGSRVWESHRPYLDSMSGAYKVVEVVDSKVRDCGHVIVDRGENCFEKNLHTAYANGWWEIRANYLIFYAENKFAYVLEFSDTARKRGWFRGIRFENQQPKEFVVFFRLTNTRPAKIAAPNYKDAFKKRSNFIKAFIPQTCGDSTRDFIQEVCDRKISLRDAIQEIQKFREYTYDVSPYLVNYEYRYSEDKLLRFSSSSFDITDEHSYFGNQWKRYGDYLVLFTFHTPVYIFKYPSMTHPNLSGIHCICEPYKKVSYERQNARLNMPIPDEITFAEPYEWGEPLPKNFPRTLRDAEKNVVYHLHDFGKISVESKSKYKDKESASWDIRGDYLIIKNYYEISCTSCYLINREDCANAKDGVNAFHSYRSYEKAKPCFLEKL